MTIYQPPKGLRPNRSIRAAICDGAISANVQVVIAGASSMANPTIAYAIANGLLDPQAPCTSVVFATPYASYGGT